jgi:hypothetical protein
MTTKLIMLRPAIGRSESAPVPSVIWLRVSAVFKTGAAPVTSRVWVTVFSVRVIGTFKVWFVSSVTAITVFVKPAASALIS